MNAETHDFRLSTDAAGLCAPVVKQTATKIQGRRYVTVEGWQAIAMAHGYTASAGKVERIEDSDASGWLCQAALIRLADGVQVATAEGFLGDDERMWTKRPVYARRAMVQTRAISRVCRTVFAHVVPMIDAGLQTTPAEEVPEGGFQQEEQDSAPSPSWREPDSQYNCKTALHKGLTIHQAELNRLGSEGVMDDLEGYTTSPEYQEFIKIATKHALHYLEGGHPAPEEFIGCFALEQKARDMIALRGNQPAEMENA